MLRIPESLTKATILKYVTEQAIFERYLGHEIRLKEMYLSPFREEKDPSFNIYVNRFNSRLWFKDHASHSGDCFKLVQLMHNDCSFLDALKIIDRDFNIGIGSTTSLPKKVKYSAKPLEEHEFKIEVKIQPYTKIDIKYWNDLLELKEIEKYLKYFKVFSSERIWINEYMILEWDYKTNNPVYAYFDKGKFKLYRPHEKSKESKWKSNLEYDQWLGLNQLPQTGDKLIISKSYKDVLLLRRLGIYAVATNGENHSFPSKLVNELKWRFKNLILWYDNDETGIKYAQTRSEEYGIQYVHNPEGEPKDISDFKLEYGMEETENLLYELCLI